MNRSDSIANLAAALAAAQAVIRAAPKDNEAVVTSAKGSYKYRYSTLADVWDACRGPLAAQGLSVIQLPAVKGAEVTLTTILAHKSGEWVSSELSMTSTAGTPQGIGSAISYARRYALSAMVGVVSDEDDDGAQASRPPQQRSPAPESASRPPPPSGGTQAPASGTQSKPTESKPTEAELAKAVAQRQVEDEQISILVRESMAAKTQRELDAVAEKVKTAPERVRAEVRPVWVAQMKTLAAPPAQAA